MYKAQTPSSSKPSKKGEFDPRVNFRKSALETKIRDAEEIIEEKQEQLTSGVDRINQVDSGYFADPVQEIETIKNQGLADYQYLIEQYEKLKVDYNALNTLGSTVLPSEAWNLVRADLDKNDLLFFKKKLFCDIEWVLGNPEVIRVPLTDAVCCQLGLLWQANQLNEDEEIGSNFISEDQLRAHFNLRKGHIPYYIQGREAIKTVDDKKTEVKEIVRKPIEISQLAHESLENNENYIKSTNEFFLYLKGIQAEFKERARDLYSAEGLNLPAVVSDDLEKPTQKEVKPREENEAVKISPRTHKHFNFTGTQWETLNWLIPEHNKAVLASRLATGSMDLEEFMRATLEFKSTGNRLQADRTYIAKSFDTVRKAYDDSIKKAHDEFANRDLTFTVSTMEGELIRLKKEHTKNSSRVRVYNGSADELVEEYFGHYEDNLKRDYTNAKKNNPSKNNSLRALHDKRITEMHDLKRNIVKYKEHSILISDKGLDISIERSIKSNSANIKQTFFAPTSKASRDFRGNVDLCTENSTPYQGYRIKPVKESKGDKVANVACGLLSALF